jgi:hypothetical protein
MNENKVPFLLCIPKERIAGVVQKIDDWQKKYHKVRYKRPYYLTSSEPDIINAPLASEELDMETEREISKPPEHQERVE